MKNKDSKRKYFILGTAIIVENEKNVLQLKTESIPGAIMYSMVTIVNNTVLRICMYILKVLMKKKIL